MVRALQLHGLVPVDTEIATGGPAHMLLPLGPFAAIVSEYPDDDPANSTEEATLTNWAMAHHTLLTCYTAKGDLLPMRPGAVFTGPTQLLATLDTQKPDLLEKFRQLKGLREYLIEAHLMAFDSAKSPDTQTGTAHLRARRAARNLRHNIGTARNDLLRNVAGRLDDIAMQVTPLGACHADRPFRRAVLVHDMQTAALRALAQDMDAPARDLGLDLVISGPWPAYSFNPDIGLSEARHAS